LPRRGSHRDAQARVLVSRCHPTRGRNRCRETTSLLGSRERDINGSGHFFPGPASAAPRSTSCNGTSACGPGRHSAGSDDTCSDATCSSGDAGPRRTSLAGMNGTNEGTREWPSSPDEEPANRAGSRLASVIDHQRLQPERSAVMLTSNRRSTTIESSARRTGRPVVWISAQSVLRYSIKSIL
jgi:hypothetical protein